MISPTNAQLILDRLIQADGWISDGRASAQRAVLTWLAQARFIDCIEVHPTQSRYRINCMKVLDKPETIYDLPMPGKFARMVSLAKEWLSEQPGREVFLPDGRALTKQALHEWLTRAIDRRINARGGISFLPGRRADEDYQIRLYRDSRRIQDHLTRRIIIHQFETDEARRRFRHLLADAA